uniref:BTB domain-containing protein n=1 Tax=Romanomermis culicivorax TaxID=13658 RepID=A0A915L878_ROMCU
MYASMISDSNWRVTIPTLPIEKFETEEEVAFGFKFWLKITKVDGSPNTYQINLESSPCSGCESYRLLADYWISILATDNNPDEDRTVSRLLLSQFELIDGNFSEKSTLNSTKVSYESLQNILSRGKNSVGDELNLTLEYGIKVREMLPQAMENFRERSALRNFEILIPGNCVLYVDLYYLCSLESAYFVELMNSAKQNRQDRAVILDIESIDDFILFLGAICTYRKPIVTMDNLDLVLYYANQFLIEKVLRTCESCLIELESMHTVRKLEYAMMYGLGLLGEMTLKRLSRSNHSLYANLEAVESYLIEMGENLDQQHPEVLEALQIFYDYVIYWN